MVSLIKIVKNSLKKLIYVIDFDFEFSFIISLLKCLLLMLEN